MLWVSYVSGSTVGMDGADLINEAGGGIVAVEVEYRLGIFGKISPSILWHLLRSIYSRPRKGSYRDQK